VVEPDRAGTRACVSFGGVVGQIMVLDIVVALDSVITAVGMARHLPVMIAAVVLAVGVMMFAAAPLSDFVHRHPPVTMLALSLLLMIGVARIADGPLGVPGDAEHPDARAEAAREIARGI
jgi:predicted tellurium resistance membrane protein TerC